MSSSQVRAFGAKRPDGPIEALEIPRREPTARDVEIDIAFCGICHSDLHSARDEWNAFMPTEFPIVPGHEIVGTVTRVGAEVTAHAVGDTVAVGCLVDSDRTCPECQAGEEQFCAEPVFTFNGPDAHLGGVTYGGYSQRVVVDEHFVLKVPKGLDLAGAAPLLCAGITTYSPLKRAGAGPGMTVGVIGIGGLGHLGVKIARAMGAQVVAFTTSESKAKAALELGAHEVVVSRDAAAMEARAGSFDFLLNTVSAQHGLDPYLALLKRDGRMTLVGAPAEPLEVAAFSLIMGRRQVSGSLIGGIKETQEMLDFCGEHGIVAEVEVIKASEINEAYERMLKSDVRYRFVIDIASMAAG